MTIDTTESWRVVWRKFAALLSDEGLHAIRDAIVNDDPRLLQGVTTQPPPLACVQDFDVEAACLIGVGCWAFIPGTTVGEVEATFASLCSAVDEELGEPAGCHHLLNAWDETPRAEARAILLPEVILAIELRQQAA